MDLHTHKPKMLGRELVGQLEDALGFKPVDLAMELAYMPEEQRYEKLKEIGASTPLFRETNFCLTFTQALFFAGAPIGYYKSWQHLSAGALSAKHQLH